MAKKVSRVARRPIATRKPGSPTPTEAFTSKATEVDTFLARKTLGLPRYRLIAVAAAFALVFVAQGALRTLGSYTNRAEEWFATNGETMLAVEYADRSPTEPAIAVSWDGLTGESPEKLLLLERKLRAMKDPDGWAWFPTVTRGAEPPCLLASLDRRLASDTARNRQAVELVRDLAYRQCGVPLTAIHLGGAPAVEVALDAQGKQSATTIACFTALIASLLAYSALRSRLLTASAVATGLLGAVMSLSLVYWLGGIVTLLGEASGGGLGRPDALLLTMPVVVLITTLVGAVRLTRDYGSERLAGGVRGAVERAVRGAFAPSLAGSFVTATGLGLLATSELLPVQRFGLFTALGVVAGQLLLYAMLPPLLHRFPPRLQPTPAVKPATREASQRTSFASALGVGLAGGALGVAVGLPSALSAAAACWALAPLSWGLVASASLAAGFAVEGVSRLVAEFRRGASNGLDRRRAAQTAFHRGAASTAPVALLAGLGLSMLVLSPFTPAQQLGLMAVPTLLLAVLSELVVLPVLLSGPVERTASSPKLLSKQASTGQEDLLVLPMTASRPVFVEAPVEAPAVVGPVLHRHDEPEPLSPANAALRAKLQRLRREAMGGR